MENINGVKLSGVVELVESETADQFFDAFIAFLESRGNVYGGSYRGVNLDIVEEEAGV